jgi:putative ABC transport system permease protein
MRSMLVGIRLALRAIRGNLVRATLTVLGILIGVASVVSITALGAGARDAIGEQIQSLGSNLIVVFPQNAAASGARGISGSGKHLSDEDARAIAREAISVKSVAPFLGAAVRVIFGDRNASTTAFGTTTQYLPVRDWKIARGEMWTEHDEATKAKVCILGATVARKIFEGVDPVGQTVRIGRYPYRVLAVLEEKGTSPLGGDQDDILAMPIGSMRARILKAPPGFAGILLVSATAPETTERAVDQIRSILRQRHGIEGDKRPDFDTFVQKDAQEKQGAIFNILTTLLVLVAGISLVVGGIGVMNIMLVSVTERTREIGVRMAIGAREGDIRTQFLVEAVVMAVLGGVMGVLAGAGIVAGVASYLGWSMHMAPSALAVSLGVSGVTGVVFGFVPARRAAKLDPIEALRHE